MGGAGRKEVALQLSTLTSARARAVHRGAKAGGEVGAPLVSPLHRDLSQPSEVLRGTCQPPPRVKVQIAVTPSIVIGGPVSPLLHQNPRQDMRMSLQSCGQTF